MIVSVGVVAPFEYLFKGRGSHEQTYQEEVDRCPAVTERLSKATRCTGYFATKDYSYRATRCAGDGWVTIGPCSAIRWLSNCRATVTCWC